MTHFGIICPAAAGHLNPMTTLGYELKQRGHRVTVIGVEDSQPKAYTAGLEFQVIGKSKFPKGATKELFTKLGNLSGFEAVRYSINAMTDGANLLLQEAPSVVKEAKIEALLVDQGTPEGGTVAEYLNIPFISVCNAIIMNREISIPPFLTAWDFDPSWSGYLRNRFGYMLFDLILISLKGVINNYRQKWGLSTCHNTNEYYSRLAQISQQPHEFEFPRQELPSFFHFTGPYSNPASREPVSFHYEKLTGQPLIYISLGTIQNRLLWIFQMIAEACVGLDAQLVIALGRRAIPESLSELPGNTLVVSYAPQLELLQKATLCITHAGMNTTLESLSNGVPMVAIPITNDQPGVAARIAWTGTGEFIPQRKMSVEKLCKAIKQVLVEDSYKQNALRLQKAIEQAGGVNRAADIIEQAISTGKPVVAWR